MAGDYGIEVRADGAGAFHVHRNGRLIGELVYDAEWEWDNTPWFARGVLRNADGEPWLTGVGETMEEAAHLLGKLWVEEDADRYLEDAGR